MAICLKNTSITTKTKITLKNIIRLIGLLLPMMMFSQTQQNMIIQNETITTSTSRVATHSIRILPTTKITAGASFSAMIATDPYQSLDLSADENYILTRVFQAETTTGTVANQGDVIENITYLNGLGKTEQRIAIRQSPDKSDIVTHFDYDDYGRQDKEFLPYATASNGGSMFTGSILSEVINYYEDAYPNDFSNNSIITNAFAQKELEASPLNRVLKQAAPGQDWRLGGGHEIEFEYTANGVDEVRLYWVTTNFSNHTFVPSLAGGTAYYTAGELTKSVVKDENHNGTTKLHTTEEFKDKQGQVILKRTYALVNAVETAHDTYYVYDDYGNLTYVLPPKVITSDGISSSELSALCYQYVYDHKNRLVEKKIPGKGWEHIVYNKNDQPIMTQDANLRIEEQWLVTKYDQFGRVVYSGIKEHPNSRIQFQDLVENTNYTHWEAIQANQVTRGGATMYYTATAMPSIIETVHTVNYYDKYIDLPSGLPTAITNTYGVTSTTNTKGLPTVTKVRVLDTNRWITTVTYYDAKARPIYIYSKNDYLGTTDIIESKLDFVGNVIETKTTHQKTGHDAIVTIDTFDYDHAGRLISQKQRINGQAEEVIVENTYDALGQLESKEVGGGLQKVDYAYNVRGWLTGINDLDNTDPVIHMESDDLWGFSIKYNDPSYSGGEALYNGNISEVNWSSNNTNTSDFWYIYYYDALDRLTKGQFAGGGLGGRYDVSDITYDKNGNINTLKRNGHTNSSATTFGTIDNLAYTYGDGNKLLKVGDTGNRTYGFKDGINAGNDYAYDVNGNMISDANKGITNITYNHMNLPTRVTFEDGEDGDGRFITYKYDATGVKLMKLSYDAGDEYVTHYAGNYVYDGNDDELEFFSHPEGYIQRDGDEFSYVYQYKDHLGNVRLSYTDHDNNGSIDASTEIIEESNYYPFGVKHKGYNNVTTSLGNSTAQKFGFGGKELQDELGLDWYDVTARNYDAALGRWMNIDPLAEEMRRHSPYNYAFNNPIFFIDPDGLSPRPNASERKKRQREIRAKNQGAKTQLSLSISTGSVFGFKIGKVGVEADFGSKEVVSIGVVDGVKKGDPNTTSSGVSIDLGVIQLGASEKVTEKKSDTNVVLTDGKNSAKLDATKTVTTTENEVSASVFGIVSAKDSKTTTETSIRGSVGNEIASSTSVTEGDASLSASKSGSLSLFEKAITNLAKTSKLSIAIGVKIEIKIEEIK